MADWLGSGAVSVVGMEATGVYRKPVFYALEDRFDVWLCNTHHVKNVPGRKTDMSDAAWLDGRGRPWDGARQFRAAPPIRELRDLTRYRKRQLDTRAAELQRLEKVLQDAGIKLTSVASGVLSMSGGCQICGRA